MERDLIRFRGPVAAALLCPDVDEDRALQLECSRERLKKRVEVVTRNDADVRDPEVLEELARAREVDHGPAKPLAPHHDPRPDAGDCPDGAVVDRPARLPR